MTRRLGLTRSLGSDEAGVDARLESWQKDRVPARVWAQDPALWPQAPAQDVSDRMGWLSLPDVMADQRPEVQAFADEIRTEGMRHVVVLGMGGSSLAPDVLRAMFGGAPGFPQLRVLDSTHPEAVTALAGAIDPTRALFVVSSKSGTTTEPLAFYRYFWEMVRAAGDPPERHFVAITDPGTPLEKLAEEQQFRAIFRAVATVGGRYSALTMFGLVPAALLGADVRGLLNHARAMAQACGPTVPARQNPGLELGAVLGELATHGRDKLTLYAGGTFAPFPMWVEQLVAESTGKTGKGIVPVVEEPLAAPEHYGPDRLFVEIQQTGQEDAALAAHTARLEEVGHPVVRVRVSDARDVAAEFFRWEFAVAIAGTILGIDPYDQPDVELAKELARQVMAHPISGAGRTETPTTVARDSRALSSDLERWLRECRPRDYVAIQAYLPPLPRTTLVLQQIRRRLLERLRVATTLGFGPRFLHSTGQLHKGGPNSGLFLQLVDASKRDLEVPGAGYTFGELIRAQSLGDFEALRQKQRRVLRVDLGTDVPDGLERLSEALHG